MAIKRVQKRINWSPEDRKRHKAIRATFKHRPSIDRLIAEGELSGRPMSLGAYLNLNLLLRKLRPMREQARLSLADLSLRSGMDKAMLSRLENGRVPNPGIETISRYVNALGKDIEWRVVAVTDTGDSSRKTRRR
jgi:hypothetical protein